MIVIFPNFSNVLYKHIVVPCTKFHLPILIFVSVIVLKFGKNVENHVLKKR